MRPIVLTMMAVALLVSGCASKDDGPKPDDYTYSHGASEPAPDIDVGTWSGTSPAGLASLVLAEDGSGLLCTTSAEGKDLLRRVKYRLGLLLTEDNLRLAIVDAAQDAMKLQAVNDANANYELRSDPDLLLAAPVCGKRLKKLR